MAFVLSATPIYSLNDVLSSTSFSYTNSARHFTQVSALSTINGVPQIVYTALNKIQDVAINNNALIFLTDQVSLSSFLYNKTTVSSTNIGFSGLSYFNKYVFDNDSSVDILSASPQKNNFLIICPYKDNLKFNIIPLKSSMGITNEYNFQKMANGQLSREYDSVYFGNNQNNGYDNVYLQYKATAVPVNLENDISQTVYLPDKIDSFALSAAGFTENGAFGGSEPLNSDIIFVDQFGYGNSTNHGFNDNNSNGQPLCLWLSASKASTEANMIWMERWYDPNLVSQGNAFIATKNANIYNAVKDISSSFIFDKKDKFAYLRFGENRNTTYINSFSANLLCFINTWSNILVDETGNNTGFAVGAYSDEPFSEATMNGSFHFHIPTHQSIQKENFVTTGLWVYQDTWKKGIDTQYIGNFSNNEGYGLFFNTTANQALLTFPTTSGLVFGFNYKGQKVFEKSVLTTTGVSAAKIDYITTDLFGARWIYDSVNKKIYKLDTDDLISELITLPPTATISKMQINSQNHLFALNTKTKTISGFNTYGVLSFTEVLSEYYNTFEIDKNDVIQTDLADILVIDNDNNELKAWGINLYKNNVLFFHIGYKIQALNIDSENNYWVLYDTNKVLKLSSSGEKLFEKTIPVSFAEESSIEFNFVKEIKDNYDFDVGWVIFNDNKYIVKLDTNGNILKRINLRDVVNLKLCGDFGLNVHGDFTGFENKRKFFNIAGNMITSNNPAISLKINLYCGTNIAVHQLNYPTAKLIGWTHIAFSHGFNNGNTVLRLYVNGQTAAEKTITGIYSIYYGSKVSPFIIGGHSGKLGAKNVERSLNNEGYFVGKIDDLRIYNNQLSEFQVRSLFMNKHFDEYKPLTWYCPTPQFTHMEEIVQFHLNRYHGFKSNKYNLRIKNMDVTDETTKNVIESSIRETVKKIAPHYTELNEVIFE